MPNTAKTTCENPTADRRHCESYSENEDEHGTMRDALSSLSHESGRPSTGGRPLAEAADGQLEMADDTCTSPPNTTGAIQHPKETEQLTLSRRTAV